MAGILSLWLRGFALLLEVLTGGLTENVREGILKKLILGEHLVTGTLGKGIWEKFRCRLISSLSKLSILLTEF